MARINSELSTIKFICSHARKSAHQKVGEEVYIGFSVSEAKKKTISSVFSATNKPFYHQLFLM